MASKSDSGNAPSVHAALAAAMANPDLLEAWRADPRPLQEIGIDSKQVDLKQIRNFVGLVTKVRHNDLRAALPLSFKLLDRCGLSIPFFADYAIRATAIRAAGRPTQAVKVQSLMDGLGAWLDLKDSGHSLIWDILRHENAILSLRQGRHTPVRAVDFATIHAGAIPRYNGLVFHHEMTCHPLDVETALKRGTTDIKTIPRQRALYAYSADPQSGRLRISEVDEITFVILDLVDSGSSIGNIAAALRAAGVALKTRELVDVIRQLVAGGMLTTAVARG